MGVRASEAVLSEPLAQGAEITPPQLRGVLHHYSFYAALLMGVLLISAAPTTRSRVAMSIYAVGLAGCLGSSALYHRGRWSTAARRRLRHLDHAMIFVLVAGTLTPVCLLAMTGPAATLVLATVWLGSAAGIAAVLLWPRRPAWIRVTPYLVLGWLGLLCAPQVIRGPGWSAFGLLLAGGVLYSLGAILYWLRWPDPNPRVFGFHEVFHCLVVAAALVHLAAMGAFLLPYSRIG